MALAIPVTIHETSKLLLRAKAPVTQTTQVQQNLLSPLTERRTDLCKFMCQITVIEKKKQVMVKISKENEKTFTGYPAMTIGVRWLEKKHADHPRKPRRWEWHGSESSHSVEAARQVARVSSTLTRPRDSAAGRCGGLCPGLWSLGWRGTSCQGDLRREGAKQRPVCPEGQFTQRASG